MTGGGGDGGDGGDAGGCGGAAVCQNRNGATTLGPPQQKLFSCWAIVQCVLLVGCFVALKLQNRPVAGFRNRSMNGRHDRPPRLDPIGRGRLLRELDTPHVHTDAIASCMGSPSMRTGKECDGAGDMTCSASGRLAIDIAQLNQLQFASTPGKSLI